MALHLHRACSCGHAKDAHQHYRRGTDCSACDCARYRGGFVLTLRVRAGSATHRTPPPPKVVVLPDEVAAAPEPYVRPTHTAGVGGRPAPRGAVPRPAVPQPAAQQPAAQQSTAPTVAAPRAPEPPGTQQPAGPPEVGTRS